MIVNEIEQKILSKVKSISEPSEVSFQKGDTFFVTGYCKLRTMPMRKFLASFGGKQIFDMSKAKYIVVRDFGYYTNFLYEFGGGTWWHKDHKKYVIKPTEQLDNWSKDRILQNYENHFNYTCKQLTDVWLMPRKVTTDGKKTRILVPAPENPTDRITTEYYLANPDKLYIEQDLIQKLTYKFHKEHVWTKLTEDNLRSIILALETDDTLNSNNCWTNNDTDMALNAVDNYDPTDIMKYLILMYHSSSCTQYTRNKIKNRILVKDPDIVQKQSMHDRYGVNGRKFSEDLQKELLNAYPILSPDDFQKFLDI
jgi:hypothetical protein